MTARTIACMLLLFTLMLCAPLLSAEESSRRLPRLTAPRCVWVEPFAATPVELEGQLVGKPEWKLYELSPMASDIYNQAVKAKRHGVVLVAGRGDLFIGKFSAARWILPGTQCLTIRKGDITGHLKVTVKENKDLILDLLPGSQCLIAPGDHIIQLEEFAIVTPRVCWTPVPTATGYRVERICRSKSTNVQVVYEGAATSFTDPTLLEALSTDDVYEYRVWALRGEERSAHPGIASNVIKETPFRAEMANRYPGLHRGTLAYTDALIDALQYHPNPVMRLSAAWELRHAHDRSLLSRRQYTTNPYPDRVSGFSSSPLVHIDM